MRNAICAVFLGWGAASFAIGCGKGGPPEPKTHPVKGKVVLKSGQPLKGGLIEFRNALGSGHTVNGNIEDDGTFSLHTLIGNKKLDGAPEGDYVVNVIPPQEKDQTSIPVRVLQPRQKIASAVTTLTIEVEKLAK